jgi:hypothetical protein
MNIQGTSKESWSLWRNFVRPSIFALLVAGTIYFIQETLRHKAFLGGMKKVLVKAHEITPFDSSTVDKREFLDGYQSLSLQWDEALHLKGYKSKDDEFFKSLSSGVQCLKLAALIWKAKDDAARGEVHDSDLLTIQFTMEQAFGQQEAAKIIQADGTGIRGCLEPNTANVLITTSLDVARGNLKLADAYYNRLLN